MAHTTYLAWARAQRRARDGKYPSFSLNDAVQVSDAYEFPLFDVVDATNDEVLVGMITMVPTPGTTSRQPTYVGWAHDWDAGSSSEWDPLFVGGSDDPWTLVRLIRERVPRSSNE